MAYLPFKYFGKISEKKKGIDGANLGNCESELWEYWGEGSFIIHFLYF